jgi:hypothetical protein
MITYATRSPKAGADPIVMLKQLGRPNWKKRAYQRRALSSAQPALHVPASQRNLHDMNPCCNRKVMIRLTSLGKSLRNN